MSNDMAAELFGYTDDSLVGKRLSDLLQKKHEQTTLEDLELDPETGNVHRVSGKIVSNPKKLSLKPLEI